MKISLGPPIPDVIKTRCPNCQTAIWTTHRGELRCRGCYNTFDITENETKCNHYTHPERTPNAQ